MILNLEVKADSPGNFKDLSVNTVQFALAMKQAALEYWIGHFNQVPSGIEVTITHLNGEDLVRKELTEELERLREQVFG